MSKARMHAEFSSNRPKAKTQSKLWLYKEDGKTVIEKPVIFNN